MSCITLLSDFGLQDASVAKAKGIMMQYSALPVIDVSHMIAPYHLQQAAYLLKASYRNFPAGSFHVLLFDFFAEKEPRQVLCEKDGHFFLAPDNGILSLAFDGILDNVWNCFEMRPENSFNDLLHKIGSTVKKLYDSSDTSHLESCSLKNAPLNWKPVYENNTVECHVIHIDRFENVVVNITKDEFESLRHGRSFRIQFMRDEEIHEISRHYNDVKESEKLCRFNSTGYLEIAINRGAAASLFGLRLHHKQHLMYNTIKIFFE